MGRCFVLIWGIQTLSVKFGSDPCVGEVRSGDHQHHTGGERERGFGPGPVVWHLISN